MNVVLTLLYHFVVASILTFGFALFMHTPKKHVIYASITGGFGWALYIALTKLGLGIVIASFFAACLIGLFGEIFARVLKAPSIVFIVPGMLPLAPGSGLYYTMESLIAEEYIESVAHGTTTVAIAGAISLGIILVTSFARTIYSKNYKFYKPLQDTKQNSIDEKK